ncbi:MAG TPA: cyclase family protein [Candidatus Dormibacteraeota bacterium]|jgi:hypothetical protein|nr:cyclase family protein [Candidatus Dormibacteraeota bacterium]
MATEHLPAYDDLPVVAGAPPRSAWGVWGDGDVFGCLNLLTETRLLEAVRAVRRGAVFNLNLEMELPDPPLFGRARFEHRVSGFRVGHDEELWAWNTQSSSQWDGFRHVRHAIHGFFGGVADEDHGVHHWARRGIAGRAVLADVARWRTAAGRPLRMDASDPIEPDDVHATLEAQGVRVEVGDILLLRTGWVYWYRSLDADGRGRLGTARFAAPGLRPGEPTARMLWNLHVAAVAADNPALEVWPPGALATHSENAEPAFDSPETFVHRSLLPLLGLPIGELWDLDRLAQDCADDGVYSFLLTSAPLNLRSGVASPPNALAIK